MSFTPRRHLGYSSLHDFGTNSSRLASEANQKATRDGAESEDWEGELSWHMGCCVGLLILRQRPYRMPGYRAKPVSGSSIPVQYLEFTMASSVTILCQYSTASRKSC